MKLIPLAILILLIGACVACRSAPERGIVTLEVGIDYSYGGMQPVARQEFYLLDADLTELMPAMMGLEDLTAFTKEQRDSLIQAHTAAKGTTDLQGKISFAPVLPGAYYIVGWSTTRKDYEVIIWNYRVDVKPGPQHVSLSSSDAAKVAH